MTDTRTGRPRIGQQVTTTLPDLVREEVEKYAAEDDVPLSEELRLLVIQGLFTRRALKDEQPLPADTETEKLREELRPAAGLVASWIAADPDTLEMRSRFRRLLRQVNTPKDLVQLLLDAAMELADAGRPETITATVLGRLSEAAEWRYRGQLYFQVVAELQNRQISLALQPGEADDAEDDETPGDGPEFEDYA